MRNLKRTLSLALASVMLVGMMSVGASAVNASDFTDADEIVNKDAVSTMTALGIINGKEDGSYFDPTGNVTRAEMAKMLCVAINGGVDPVLGVKDTPTFTDIKGTWAESYIEYCAANGIIAGRGNNKFDPTGTVSATEAAKMLLGVLGYSAEKSGLVGNDWAINTNVLANQNGLYKKLANLNANTLLTRDNAAQMLYNALDVHMVTYDYIITGTAENALTTKPQINDTDKGTLLEEKFDAVKVEGVVVANEVAKGTVIFQQMVSVMPESNYVLSAWVTGVLQDAESSAPDINLRAKVTAPDGTSLLDYAFAPIPAADLSQWTQLGALFESGPYMHLYLEILAEGDGKESNTFAIDDISLMPVVRDNLLSITQEADQESVREGDTVGYTVTIKNTSDYPLEQVSFQGEIPVGLTFVPGSLVINGICAGVGSVLSFLPIIVLLFFFL